MNRVLIALAALACVFAFVAPARATAPVDQSAWAGQKKEVRLPSGIRLAYVELGDPRGQPLLLLHGYTDSSRSWSTMAPFLKRYRLIMPDQRGHGAADAPRCCYSLSVFADDARQLLDALDIKRADVVGHSLGSMVAITMAAEYPDRVSSLTLIGSTALAPVRRGDWLYSNAAAVKGRLDPASAFAKDWHPKNQPTAVDADFADAVNRELYAIPEHVWVSVMRELVDVPVGRHAADVVAPVLILSGGKDPLFPAHHHAALLKTFPQAEAHVFPDQGHNPNWEQPEAVARRIDDFLQRRN